LKFHSWQDTSRAEVVHPAFEKAILLGLKHQASKMFENYILKIQAIKELQFFVELLKTDKWNPRVLIYMYRNPPGPRDILIHWILKSGEGNIGWIWT